MMYLAGISLRLSNDVNGMNDMFCISYIRLEFELGFRSRRILVHSNA